MSMFDVVDVLGSSCGDEDARVDLDNVGRSIAAVSGSVLAIPVVPVAIILSFGHCFVDAGGSLSRAG